MSEDEYEMTSFKRRKVTEDPASDMESETDLVPQPTQRRRLKRKQIDIDDLDILEENEGHGENSDHNGSDNEEQESALSEEDSFEKPPEVYHEYRGAQDINFENENDFIEDDENNQFVYTMVGENRIQYYNAAVEYFGNEILYFINGSSAAEELQEGQTVPHEVPQTKEMEAMKEAEERFWKEENLMTERDLEIAQKDIPERIQLTEPLYMISDFQELQDCCTWIYHEARLHYGVTFDDGDETLVKESIGSIVRLYAEEHLEPQYIFTFEIRYLKYFRDEDVWLICDLYSQYIQLLERCKSLKESINSLRDTLSELDRTDSTDCLDRLLLNFSYDIMIPNEQRFNLIQQYFTLLNTAIRAKLDTTGEVKLRGSRREMKFYRLFSPELLDLALRYNVELDRVSMNIQSYQQQTPPQDPGMTPEQLVEEFYQKNPSFISDKSPSELFSEASSLYALCLSFDPYIVELARNDFYESAVITSNPTERGVREIDSAHSLFGLHRLRNKPIDDMREEDFLLLEQGANDGLITYDINVKEGVASLQQKLRQLLTIEYSPYSLFQQQSVQNCCQILQRVTVDYLKERIRKRSYEEIATKCGEALHNRISYKGYCNKHKGLATVLALAMESEPTNSSIGVVVNENGVVVDHLILGRGGRINKNDMEGFLQNVGKIFSNNSSIDVIILNTALQNQTTVLQKQISEKIGEICTKQNTSKPEVIIMDDSVAHLRCFCDNDVYYPASLNKYKLGIYCARYFQNPLREVASLFDKPADPTESTLIQLELNSYQSIIPPTYLVKEYEKRICMEVAEACVCIQDTMAYQDGYGLLQFIPGLGFRKARDFVKHLVAEGTSMRNRDDMKSIMNMGDVVFKNCSGFIKFAVRKMVNIEELHDDNMYHVLDMLRIPCHLYPSMNTICEYITRRGNACVGQEAVIEVMLHSQSYERKQDDRYTLLTDDDLNDLENENPAFIDIPMLAFCSELREWGRDMRDSITNLNPEDLFYMISGETRESFHKGTEVTATVIRVFDGKRIAVRLDNNLMGTISGRDFSDKPSDIEIASNIVGAGDVITCRVLHIDTVNFTVDLTSRPSVVNNRNASSETTDSYFQQEPEEWETAILDDIEKRLVEEQKARQLIKRHIFSNLYFCVNYQGAIDILREKPQGSCLFRPSPDGLEQIVLTYKILDDLYISYDVYEHKKDPTDRSKLGAVLELCRETYTDLEEIVDRFVGSISQLVSDVTCYEKYVNKTDEEVDLMIQAMHEKQPKYLPYLVSFSRKQPGLLKISYYKSNRVNHEYAELRPMGILYDNRIFQHVESWIAYFKTNIRSILSKRIEEQQKAGMGIPKPPYYSNSMLGQPASPGYGQQPYNAVDINEHY